MILFENIHSGKNNYLYCQTDKNLSFAEHTHFGYEFIAVQKGELVCTLFHTPMTLSAGKAMLILPNQIHSYETKEYSESFLCVFSPDIVEDFFRETNGEFFEVPVFDFHDDEKIGVLKNSSSNRFAVKSVLYYICGRAFDSSKLQKRMTADPDFTYKLLYFVQENYAEDISLKLLAEKLGYNYTYLSCLFHKTFQCHFSEFIRGYRLERACDLLKTTDKSVARVAIDCGFHTIRNFNYAFSEKYHLTPTEYRKRESKKIT